MKDLLFLHNRTGYEAVVSAFQRSQRAAVVHPTGTGKSFIGFQLCADNASSCVCWLSPSEYIFKTQVENYLAAGGFPLENICFFTYAKLALLSQDEMTEIAPEYIVLDEFHRCGAETWGAGVQRLLALYPQAKILGLSATAIRYLDNQRNMADELFFGNVVSEMTLGEAVVRGILSPPKYVLSVYAYQKEVGRYALKVKNAKNAAVRASAEKYLETLRRALEKADGLDVVFDKHMPERTGKYVAFCADFQHMHEMVERVPEWFSKVDPSPHIYKAYSNDPVTNKAFTAFKADDSPHLKLLFCIDMLNEGVHLADVSGVILFRPTVSPIVYKQQIGRALSASSKREPVIFDIVNNIENLYSIGTIEEEMRTAANFYRVHGMPESIVNEHFRIIDEVRDCRVLFEKLNETLTASWEMMYQKAAEYFAEHGDLNVPKRYKTAEGYSLGSWLQTQRQVRRGEQYGNLDEERIAKLDKLGMVWENVRDVAWEKHFALAKAYHAEHGNLAMPVDARYGGVKLGQWLAQLRTYRKNGASRGYLTEVRIAALNDLGMVWDVPDYAFEKNYGAALEYYRQHGNLNVPTYYVTQDGLRLGRWIVGIRDRKNGKGEGAPLSQEQIARLEQIAFPWTGKNDALWESSYQEARAYKQSHGDMRIPVAYVTESGLALGKWIRKQIYNADTLSKERKERLARLGVEFDKRHEKRSH